MRLLWRSWYSPAPDRRRRCSEIVAVRAEDLTRTPEGYACRLHVTKADQSGVGRTVPVKGDAAAALTAWLNRLADAGITQGPLFRAATRRGPILGLAGPEGGPAAETRGLTGEAVMLIMRKRARLAGLKPAAFTCHSPRYGLNFRFVISASIIATIWRART